MQRIDEMSNVGAYNTLKSVYMPSEANPDNDKIPHVYIDIDGQYQKWYIPREMPANPEACMQYFEVAQDSKISQDLWDYLNQQDKLVFSTISKLEHLKLFWLVDFAQDNAFRE